MSAADVLSRVQEQRSMSTRALAVPRNAQQNCKRNSGQASTKYFDMSLHKMQELSGIRPSHKQVEQHRRLKAKQFFEELRELLPGNRDSRCDRNRILMAAIEHIKDLKGLERGNLRKSLEMEEEEREEEDLMFDMQDLDSSSGKLSHNEVEQRRRLLAKKLFEELRRLLPESGKCDKNTILLNAIAAVKTLHAAQHKQESSSPSPQSGSLASLLSPAPSTLSASPQDVTEAATAFVTAMQAVAGEEEEDEEEDEDDEQEEEEAGSSLVEANRRRKRAPWHEETHLPPLSELLGDRKRRMLAGRELQPREERSISLEEEAAAFQALSLLSECAERMSLPSTPA
mmetsp:Transcript_24854/g.49657  ORF Transcript_24854/g.49657 Transcript_24854/m.49657 type:complete len:342 (-) Transcript_24854:301-1326(-)|eukprot:CAMPEP_0196739722 /NCGR_PEP_ID=MMETSP1091-20130531/24856_1 /TAXON_ID=302021 /ORGANISM="Rhodomonas sp., Strain CCMP768" /LENGTH=341 /DNA_ID=CAMNT_0042084435 /DNA_START=132 /DNA_END=1157 /DNA_ORIENTATION=-